MGAGVVLSVIIATRDSERLLVPTLAALVPGATAGLISEVVIVDGGSRDDTAEVADIAGCRFLAVEGPQGRRLKAGAAAARAPRLLFLSPGTVLDAQWVAEVGRFAGGYSPAAHTDQAAVFRRGIGAQPALREAFLLVCMALGAGPRPEQGLIITKQFYDALGGHREDVADPEGDLLGRIGRRRILTLPARAFSIG